MSGMHNLLGKLLWSVVTLLCLAATLLFLCIPLDSLDTGIVYKGF